MAESWIICSDAHAQPFLDAWSRFEPEQCSALGMPGFDEATKQLPVDLADRLIETFRRLLASTRRALGRETHPEVRFDLGILVETTELLLEKLEAERDLLMPYTNVLETIYQGLAGFRRPTAASPVRLRRYTGQGRLAPDHRAGRRPGASPPRRCRAARPVSWTHRA